MDTRLVVRPQAQPVEPFKASNIFLLLSQNADSYGMFWSLICFATFIWPNTNYFHNKILCLLKYVLNLVLFNYDKLPYMICITLRIHNSISAAIHVWFVWNLWYPLHAFHWKCNNRNNHKINVWFVNGMLFWYNRFWHFYAEKKEVHALESW